MQVLLNHVVYGDLTLGAIHTAIVEGFGSAELKTLSGGTLFVSTTDGGLHIQSRGINAPGARVITANTITCPGPVHGINTVLLPTFPNGTTVDFPKPETGVNYTYEDGPLESGAGSGETPPVAAAVFSAGSAGWLGVAVAVAGMVAIAV